MRRTLRVVMTANRPLRAEGVRPYLRCQLGQLPLVLAESPRALGHRTVAPRGERASHGFDGGGAAIFPADPRYVQHADLRGSGTNRQPSFDPKPLEALPREIGRASCRE